MSERTTEARLALCDPAAVPHFRKALDAALGYGADAYVERDPWRTPEQQAAKVKAGLSQRMDSAHTHTIGGEPASRAVHLVSRAYFYFDPPDNTPPELAAKIRALLPAFAVRVGAACLKEGLVTGVLYGPKDRAQAEEHREQWDLVSAGLRLAMTDERWRDAEALLEVGQSFGACWDPLHGEWRPA